MADNDVGGSAKVATQQIFANRLPTSSQSTPVEPHRACRQEAPEPGDSEGASGPVKSAPTPPSSQGTVPSSSAHNASESSRKGKRRPESQAADDSVPVHKKTETADQSSSDEYKLVVVQEPTTGSAFEDNLLGRIGLAPPLIVELHVSKEGKIDDASTELPFLICQCSLLDESGAVADMVDQSRPTSSARASLMPPTPPTRGRRGRSSLGRRGTSASAVSSRSSASTEASTTGSSDDAPSTDAPGSQGRNSPQLARMLYGTIVAGPQQYVSPQSEAKSYFFFPEISVRTPGKFKIQCRLMRLALPGMPAPEQGVLTSTETQLFDVVKRSDYTAPYITDLSRHFARQGVPLLLPPGVSAD